jgi:hypothetical protein
MSARQRPGVVEPSAHSAIVKPAWPRLCTWMPLASAPLNSRMPLTMTYPALSLPTSMLLVAGEATYRTAAVSVAELVGNGTGVGEASTL